MRRNQNLDDSCLIVVLGPSLTLTMSPSLPFNGFSLGTTSYRDFGLGEWTGFYDWLRKEDDHIIGVRYWLNGGVEDMVSQVASLSYLRIDPGRYIEIYFSDSRQIDRTRSVDQDFIYDPVFRSDDGEYAIGFAMENLSEMETLSIRNAPVTWEAFRPLEGQAL